MGGGRGGRERRKEKKWEIRREDRKEGGGGGWTERVKGRAKWKILILPCTLLIKFEISLLYCEESTLCLNYLMRILILGK